MNIAEIKKTISFFRLDETDAFEKFRICRLIIAQPAAEESTLKP